MNFYVPYIDERQSFYVCTESNGVDEGVPFPMGLTPHGRAIDFDPPRPQRLN